MNLLFNQILNHKEAAAIPPLLESGGLPALVSGLSPVHRANLAAALHDALGLPLFAVCADDTAAETFARDLNAMTGEEVTAKTVENTAKKAGYKKVILPCSTRTTHFEKYTKYYKKVAVTDGVEYENHFISKWRLTEDTVYKPNKKYYRPTRIPPYNEPDEDNWVELIPGTDYNVGDPLINVDPEIAGSDEACGDIISEFWRQSTYGQSGVGAHRFSWLEWRILVVVATPSRVGGCSDGIRVRGRAVREASRHAGSPARPVCAAA